MEQILIFLNFMLRELFFENLLLQSSTSESRVILHFLQTTLKMKQLPTDVYHQPLGIIKTSVKNAWNNFMALSNSKRLRKKLAYNHFLLVWKMKKIEGFPGIHVWSRFLQDIIFKVKSPITRAPWMIENFIYVNFQVQEK